MSLNLELRKEELELKTKEFELEQRQAKALSVSAFFPNELRNDIASAVIIYDLARRMDISVLEVAQSIYIIYGKPSFETKFLVARLNQSGKIKGGLNTVISPDKQSAYCWAIDSESGEKKVGMTYTLAIAKAEGLVDKKGSKWKTMPELMLRYRAQSNFINEFYPEVKFGCKTVDEAIDAKFSDTSYSDEGSKLDLNAVLSESVKDEIEDAIIEEAIIEEAIIEEATEQESKEEPKEAKLSEEAFNNRARLIDELDELLSKKSKSISKSSKEEPKEAKLSEEAFNNRVRLIDELKSRGVMKITAQIEVDTYTDEQVEMALADPVGLDTLAKRVSE